MTEGNLQVLEILAYWLVEGPAAAAVVVRDERRLRPDRAARAWPAVSRDAAIFNLWLLGFHPAAMLVFFATHFVRTRGLGSGLARALGWEVAVVGLGLAAIYGVDAIFGAANGAP